MDTLIDEVGDRVMVALRRENHGLLSQRSRCIGQRECKDHGWRVVYGPDRTAIAMEWLGVQGARI